MNQPAVYTGYLFQGGLGMPDREYYLSTSPEHGRHPRPLPGPRREGARSSPASRRQRRRRHAIVDLETRMAARTPPAPTRSRCARPTTPGSAPSSASARSGARLEDVLRRRRTRRRSRRSSSGSPSAVTGLAGTGEAGAPRHLEGLADLPRRRPRRPAPPPGLRGGELRLLRQDARRHAASWPRAGSAPSRRRARSARGRSGSAKIRNGRRRRQAVRPAPLPARGQGADRGRWCGSIAGAFDQRIEALDWMAPDDQGPGPGEGADPLRGRRLPRALGGLRGAGDLPRRPRGQRAARRALRLPPAARAASASRWTRPSGAWSRRRSTR